MDPSKAFAYVGLAVLVLAILFIIMVMSLGGALMINSLQYSYNSLLSQVNSTYPVTPSNVSTYTGLNTQSWMQYFQNGVAPYINYVVYILLAVFIAVLLWTWRR